MAFEIDIDPDLRIFLAKQKVHYPYSPDSAHAQIVRAETVAILSRKDQEYEAEADEIIKEFSDDDMDSLKAIDQA